MNENVDLTKILDGCPIGTEFYHAGYGRVWLVDIDLYCGHPIRLSTAGDSIADVSVTKEGTLNILYKGECLLFPSKYQRDWSKFVRFWDKESLDKSKTEKFNPKTLQPFDRILARDYGNDTWTACLFSHHADELDNDWYVCGNTYWHFIIPYNDDTKHLVGTKEDCPKYYKWWEE